VHRKDNQAGQERLSQEGQLPERAAMVRRERLVRLTGAALIAVVLVATVEIAAFFYTTYLAKGYGILFFLPHITEDYATYAARVNSRLGWPSPQALQAQGGDVAGKGLSPGSEPKKIGQENPISAYGDSFTAGFGVEPEHTWSKVLGEMLGCSIANYGVPGYGTDQSYLRFHDNNRDAAKIVLLGHLSENIQRNVNQLRNFLIPSSQCQTKPRFVLDAAGHLQLVPIPQLSAENYEHFIKNPERFLKHDYFSPGGQSGAQKLEFPYTWSILKAYKFFYDRYILGYNSYLQFYLPEHPSQAFPLTMAIIKQWHQEAQKRGKHPILLIFPTNEDFRVYQRDGKFAYEPLLHELTKAHIEYIDLGTELLKRLGDKPYMDIFSGEKYFHFNEEGNRLVAQIIFDYFIANRYVARR